MKNKTICESWDRFVQHTKKLLEPWKAASFCRICSDYFQLLDFILPTSSQGTCRLIPSTSISTNGASIYELHSMVYSNKRPFPSLDPENLPLAATIQRTATTNEREALKSKLAQKVESYNNSYNVQNKK